MSLFWGVKSKELVMDLLQSAYRFDPEIQSVDYINTELSAERDGAKACRLDVAVKLAAGNVIDLEIQTHQDSSIRKRSIAYAPAVLSFATGLDVFLRTGLFASISWNF